MTHESKLALDRIVKICEDSQTLTPTQVRIFYIALEGLGLVACQRTQIVQGWKRSVDEEKRKKWSLKHGAQP